MNTITIEKKLTTRAMGVAMILSLSACNGILDDIYDAPQNEIAKEYGFIHINNNNNSGIIYINATEYTEWHYIDLHNKQVTTTNVNDNAPATWDFAIHRYDAKTNNATVAETNATDITTDVHPNSIEKEKFVADVWTTDKITTDMSQMMDGIIVYAEDYRNPCLSQWLNVDTSTMPPVYTLSNKVYIVKLSDGTHAALRLKGFMNDATIKGYMTIEYSYPID